MAGDFLYMVANSGIEIPRIVGVASTGCHKARSLQPLLGEYGHMVQSIRIDEEIEELEHVSPRQVIRRKIIDYARHAESTLAFWAEVKKFPTPGVFVVMDVLAENAPEGPKSPLRHSDRVMKKPKRDPIMAVTKHFAVMAEQEEVDGRLWNAYILAAGMAPIDANGQVQLEQAVSLWENPIWFGYTRALVDVMADSGSVARLIEKGCLPVSMFSAKSIEGLKQEYLVEAVATMRNEDGMSVRVLHNGTDGQHKVDIIIDSRQDRGALDFLFQFLQPAMANVTSGLARQMNEVMKGFPA